MTSGQIQPESGECWGWQQMAPALRLGPVADPAPIAEPDQWHWLLVRRSIADPEDLAYCACFGVGKVSLAEPARVAGARWIIEDAFKEAKQEAGPVRIRGAPLGRMVSAHHPGAAGPRLSRGDPALCRCWRWQRGATLLGEFIPLTVPEVRRLLCRLL